MAQKRKSAKAGPKGRLGVVIAVKGTPAWKQWVDELADMCRLDTSKLIDLALVEFAKAHGFTKVAPRR